MPQATLQYLTNRFGHCGFREDCELLGNMARGLGDDAAHRLIETLQTASSTEAAEVIGLLSQLDPDASNNCSRPVLNNGHARRMTALSVNSLPSRPSSAPVCWWPFTIFSTS